MRFLKTVLVLALALAWVPMTAHCKLETLWNFEFLSCGAESRHSQTEDHCDGTGCCAVENSFYKTDQEQLTVPAHDLFAVSVCSVCAPTTPLPTDFCLGMLRAPPPDLAQSWQFVCRTASPPRAPSFAS